MRHVLLIRPGAIGDFILSLPRMEQLRGEHTEVWCAGVNVSLARFADRARSIAGTGLDLVGVTEASAAFAALSEFDEIHSWYGTKRPEFRDAVRGLPFRFHDFDERLPGVPRIATPAVARLNLVVLHPFASSPAKRWPLECFRELAAHFAETRFLAGPEEELDGAVRIADLYELGCWLTRASLYIGNDSGITHLAAAVGTPTLALFGPTEPAIWSPRGDRTFFLRKEPLASLEPAEVFAFLCEHRLWPPQKELLK